MKGRHLSIGHPNEETEAAIAEIDLLAILRRSPNQGFMNFHMFSIFMRANISITIVFLRKFYKNVSNYISILIL